MSVSCETLVIGAATIGREYKQTQKMFLSSADKPLSAVGTLTSLLCNSAKVVEKLLHRHSEPKAKNPKKQRPRICGRSDYKKHQNYFFALPFVATFFGAGAIDFFIT